MFNIVAVSGSPRREGNTELLLNAALEPFITGGHSVHKFYMSEKNVAPCIACDACVDDSVCAVEDDMGELLAKVSLCDAMIVGSPVYSRNITAQLLAVFNRFHCHKSKRMFADRICFGGAIAVGGSPNSQGITLSVIYNFFLSQGVCCVSAVLNGVSAVAQEKGEVLSQPKSLHAAKVLGENILKLLMKTKGSA